MGFFKRFKKSNDTPLPAPTLSDLTAPTPQPPLSRPSFSAPPTYTPDPETDENLSPIERLIKQLGSGNPEVQQAAADGLVLAGEAAVEPLVAALSDEKIRKTVEKVLQKLGPLATTPLINSLRGDLSENLYAKLSAQDILIAMGAPAVDPLISLLSDSELADIAAFALFKIGSPSVEKLIAVLTDPNPRVRENAAGALNNLADERAVEPLIPLLDDEDEKVRFTAVSALAYIGSPAALEALRRLSPASDLVEAFLYHPDPEDPIQQERIAQLVALGHPALRQIAYGIKRNLPRFTETVQFKNAGQLCEAMSQFDHERARRLLIMLWSTSVEVRDVEYMLIGAVRGMARAGDNSVASSIRGLKRRFPDFPALQDAIKYTCHTLGISLDAPPIVAAKTPQPIVQAPAAYKPAEPVSRPRNCPYLREGICTPPPGKGLPQPCSWDSIYAEGCAVWKYLAKGILPY